MAFIQVIDGVDGTGKTTVCSILKRRSGGNVKVVGEFSDSVIGREIQTIVDRNRYFRLSDRDLPATELFYLVSDVALKYEESLRDDTARIVMDRGILSAIAYQTVRWELKHGLEFSDRDSVELLNIFFALIPRAREVQHVCLSIGIDLVNSRLQQRGETPLSDRGLDTLDRMQKRMLYLGARCGSSEINVDNETAERVADMIEPTT